MEAPFKKGGITSGQVMVTKIMSQARYASSRTLAKARAKMMDMIVKSNTPALVISKSSEVLGFFLMKSRYMFFDEIPAQETKQAARVDIAMPAIAVRKKAAKIGCQVVLAYSSVNGSAF
ncbi:hypothetical protein ES705_46132 [subsurface metagenome]